MVSSDVEVPVVPERTRSRASQHEAWVDQFRRTYRRAPLILHVGNIANNGYNVAKQLHRAGLDGDVICSDYYHIMGSPEWEEADIVGAVSDHFFPDWKSVDLKGYRRPRWFAQGPTWLCVRYLVARRKGRKWREALWWQVLELVRAAHASGLMRVARRADALLPPRSERSISASARAWNRSVGEAGWTRTTGGLLLFLYLFRLGVRFLVRSVHYLGWQLTGELRRFELTAGRLSEEFRRLYPAREDQMSAQELQDYRSVVPLWRELFACYDLIQAYATSPIIPMLAGARPYVGFEHGTLRDFTLKQNAVSRATTLAYRLADHVFITNGDCLEYARAIGLKDYSPMLHPVDEERIRSVSGDYEGLHRELGRKWIFLCPLRHDWEAKGTDRYVRALPALVEAVGDDFSVLMMKWGKELEASRRLSDALGVSHLIRWIEPLGRRRLIEMQKSVDAVFDQLVLPHFGGTAPEALAAGVPVVMSYDPRSTEWLVERPAPILSARTTEDIVEAVKRALDPEWLTPFRSAAREWIDGCHNGSVLIERHLVAYRRVLERYGTLVERPA